MAQGFDEADGLPRPIALDGASNVRDLGGWPAADGRMVRFGMVLRGAGLHGLSEADLSVLAGHGLRTICDLRSAHERLRWRSRGGAIAGVTVLDLPIDPTVGASLRDIIHTREATGADTMTLLRTAYAAYALDWSGCYRAIFDRLLDGGAPLLFHCTAGKDRTGFGAALLLTALGVPRESVREDYLATNRLWRADPEIAKRLPPAAADTLLRAHPELLDAAFEAIRGRYGGVEAYLAAAMGLDRARTEALRTLLLE